MNPIARRRAILASAIGLSALLPALEAGASGASSASSVGLRIQIHRDSKGGYRWRLRAANGKLIADGGESYTAKAPCLSGIDLVMKGAAGATVEGGT